MNIKPMDDRLLVKLIEEPVKTPGGVILPDTAKEKPQRGEVIAVGTDEDLQELIKVGDQVLFAKYAGQEIKLDGQDYLMLNRSDVLAIIEQE